MRKSNCQHSMAIANRPRPSLEGDQYLRRFGTYLATSFLYFFALGGRAETCLLALPNEGQFRFPA